MNPKRVLGRGLSALIPGAEEGGRLGDKEARLVAVEDLEFSHHQPRKLFDDNKLQELADSMKQVGILQPILVRRNRAGEPTDAPATGPEYCVVAGERRVRAARLAGIREIPAIVCTFRETEALRVALLENIQREDLGPLEEAGAYQSLLDSYGATQDELARMLGKNRSSVTNTLRLLTLEDEIKAMLEKGEISRGHAKALLGMPEGAARVRLARLCRSRGLSVRECERRVQVASGGAAARRRRRTGRPEPKEIRALRERAERALGSPVRIDRDPLTGKGSLTIRFFSDSDLERLLEIMGVNTDLS